FSDLRLMVEIAADLGASVVGLNPLHALFPHNPWHCSPYSPSSRLFLNMAYLDVEAIEDLEGSVLVAEAMASEEFKERLATCRQREEIDYGDVVSLKRWILELIFRHFREHHLEGSLSERGRAFRDWIEDGGEALQRHALYEALQEHFHAKDPGVWGWQLWPEAYQDPTNPEVSAFAGAQRERVEFFQYVQWQADHQLASAAQRAEELGLGIGLYADLAVSVDRAGAEAWSNQEVFAEDAAAGAPPDALAPQGQNWGLPPLIPSALEEAEYAPFAAILAATMRHAGALRIDHVMGLLRLFWAPQGRPASEGAYVHYPFDDLIGIVALESHRNHCLVIGEDLGTVPDEVREKLHTWGVLSYRIFFFEREEDGRFLAPKRYPRQALVAASTHDLPTLAGFWAGRDLAWRSELGIFPTREREREEERLRAVDRQRILDALTAVGLLPSDRRHDASELLELPPEVRIAVHAYLAQTPAQVMMLQWEDLLGLVEQVNLPGTTDEHPNWCRRLPAGVDELGRLLQFEGLLAALRSGPGDRRGLQTGDPGSSGDPLDPLDPLEHGNASAAHRR
ncbi:MAG: 4-alpha-glucanotransferase, partial [Deltaproteobacteria bacterium]|nr:4-alpha-glucanotransferase [Deltaproteobacteria bacterium]